MRFPTSLQLICLVSLFALGCRTSHNEGPKPPADNPAADETTADPQKDKDKTSESKPGENKPVAPEPPKLTEQQICEKDQLKVWDGSTCVDRVLAANTLYHPAFHCDRKSSGAYSNCKSIPRENLAPIRVKVAPVTDSKVELIKDLTFSSQLVYAYVCAGANQDAYLKLGTSEHHLVQEKEAVVTHSISTPVSFQSEESYELLVKANAFGTISQSCRVVIVSNQTVLLDVTSRGVLEKEYKETRNADIKLWVDEELKRIKDSDESYASYLKKFE